LIKDGKLNNAGYVLFGNNGPITLKMAVFATDEKLTFLDINRTEDNIFKLVDIALTYIKKNIRWRVEIGSLTREEIPEIPVKALREIVINSFAHAQYGTATQHEIDIHPGKVVIYNPGEFPQQYSPEDFAKKNLSSVIRNELIAKVLYLCHDIESFGSGFKRVYTLCNQDNTNCTYEKSPIGFSFIFLRKDINTQTIQQERTNNNRTTTVLSKNENIIYDLLKAQPNLTQEELALEVSKTKRTVQNIIESLKAKGLITRIGNSRVGYWEVK
jgi:ATP-dependent DNA helicase RecG